ncbi:MAG: hypothetical protein ACLT8A_13000 [Subdoligranulum sp.]
MLDKTSSIICAFGLAAAAPRSPYRHLELCGIALRIHHGCFSECGGRHPFCFRAIPHNQQCAKKNTRDDINKNSPDNIRGALMLMITISP